MDIAPDMNAYVALADAYANLSQHRSARLTADSGLAYSGRHNWMWARKAIVLGAAGDTSGVRAVRDTLLARNEMSFVQPGVLAIVIGHTGDANVTLEWLERSYAAGDSYLWFLPDFSRAWPAEVRDHPGVVSFWERLDLPGDGRVLRR